MRPNTLGVIGLGALGGSVAWQAARAGIGRIVAYSPIPSEGAAAVRVGAVTELAANAKCVAQVADFIVLAAPPNATLDLLDQLGELVAGRSAFCTDVTSVKVPVVERASALKLGHRFAGSHPLVGTHRTGFEAAAPDCFKGEVVYVTPLPDGDRAASEVADFWQRVMDAHPVTLEARTHDHMLAWTSHLPQAVASALAATLSRRGPRGVTYGPGARSTTRLAASSGEMWTDILLLNKEEVLAALDGIESEVRKLREGLEASDPQAIRRWLESGREWREKLDR